MTVKGIVCALVWLSLPSAASADTVLRWNAAALEAIRAERVTPPAASRALAMLHVAIYDAVNGITRTHDPFLVQSGGPKGASPEAAAVASAHRILAGLFPSRAGVLDALSREMLDALADKRSKAKGVEWGQTVAEAIINWRAADNADAPVEVPARSGPGAWEPTPPGYAPYLLPQWGRLVPFAIPTNAWFRPAGPPDLASDAWAADYAEVKLLGGAASAARTPEQTLIALFWADGAGTETPPGHWNRIASAVAVATHNSLEENARVFALLNVAMADAAICAWDAKYSFDFWRPITAIRTADLDGNLATEPDGSWSPLIPTPPFPEYVSGHSTFSGAAARVLARFYGSDDVRFSVGSDALPGVVRAFGSFSEAATEAALSRLYGGIHFSSSISDGMNAGVEIGDWVSAHVMRRGHHRSSRQTTDYNARRVFSR